MPKMKMVVALPILLAVIAFGLLIVSDKERASSPTDKISSAPAASSQFADIPDKPDFNWDIVPILSEDCFRCHGPDAEVRKASLRLDDGSVALAELKEDRGKYAIVPGHPEQSEVIRRITSTDPKIHMPPPELHKVISARDVAILSRWISQGAKFKPHWSLIPPKKVLPPQTKYANRVVNNIDRFVFARLEREGLGPSPEADRATLISRVSLTLTGLPPSLKEVDAFVNDKSPNAYEKVVDRLLASPAYGERMAAYWLNVSRWADTDGFLDDFGDRFQWPWRDWMISAFNKNMPYDQFVTWQLAGDLLPNHTKEQVLATTFLRLGKRSSENGNVDEEYRVEYALDRANTVGIGFLGLTVQCARCHDHKYDPISQKDYYSLVGFFNNVDEPGFYPPGRTGVTAGPTIPWTDKATDEKLAEADAAIHARQMDYLSAKTAAMNTVAGQVDAFLQRSEAAIADAIRKSIESKTVAYYPFDTTAPIPEGKIPKRLPLKPPRENDFSVPPPPAPGFPPAPAGSTPPAENRKLTAVSPSPALAQGAAQSPTAVKNPSDKAVSAPKGSSPANGNGGPAAVAQVGAKGQPTGAAGGAKPNNPFGSFKFPPLPGDWVTDKMVFSPNMVSPGSPAILQNALLKPGKKGNALWFDDTNKGMLTNDVGLYERTQPFGFDVLVYLASVYKDSTILNNRDDENQGGSGYQLNLEDNVLRFDLIHARPFNMISIATKKPLPIKKWVHICLTYDGSSGASGVKLYLNGELADVEIRRDNLTESDLPMGGGIGFDPWVGFSFGKRFKPQSIPGGAIDELRIFKRVLTPLEVRYLDKEGAALEGNRDALRRGLLEMASTDDPSVMKAEELLADAREAQNKIISVVPHIMVMGDAPKRRSSYVLLHGLYDQHGDQVQPQGLDRVLPWNNKWPRNRIGLTKWLFDPMNPLTSRVMVNRLWQLNFGKGIVETSADFGFQGSIPTNPDLLDWLAADFMQSHWNIKRMQKMIVMSATFRQSSNVPGELLQKDPRNQLLARGPRVRLPAEMVRDSALFAGGLLVDKVGGPSVFPYQPDGVWQGGDLPGIDANGGYPSPKPDHLEDLHRRSIYTYVKRNVEPPSMAVFDMNDRSYCTVKVDVSNSPLQALVLLDDPQFIEAYRGMATRAIEASSDRQQQIQFVYRLAIRRKATTEELKIMRQYYDEEASRFQRSPADRDKFLEIGLVPIAPDINRVQLAAMTSVAAAVMNTSDASTLR
jgi:hypothetical protein